MDRDTLLARLSERGIDCSVHFIPVHQMPYMRAVMGDHRDASACPTADAVFEQIVSLPLYPTLLDSEVDRVCATIAELRGVPTGHPSATSPAPGGVA
jgi:dTDP-4-amino-4,6-dideoxygalactose transaminase